MWLHSALLVLSTVLCTSRTASGLGSSCSAPLGSGIAVPVIHIGLRPSNTRELLHSVLTRARTKSSVMSRTLEPVVTVSLMTRPLSTPLCRLEIAVVEDLVNRQQSLLQLYISPKGKLNTSINLERVIYSPNRTYLVSSPINTYYYTQMIGDAKNLPTLLASPNFNGFAVIDADPYIPNGSGAQWFGNTNNFFRSVRNLIIDLRQIPSSNGAIGLHWQVAQATSLINVVVEMSTAAGTNHQGMFMENGSGGFMGDIVFNGGKFGIQVGNQQFTVRNLTVNNANIGTPQPYRAYGTGASHFKIGFDLTTGGTTISNQGVGSEAIIDAVVTNTPIFIRSSAASIGSLTGSLVLNNIQLTNVPTAVGVVGGATVLAGGTTTIASWGQGNVYSGTGGQKTFVQGNIVSAEKPSVLLDNSGRIFGKTHPQYANYATSQIVSVKSQGAKGDGTTDDTAAIQNVFDQYAGCKIIFFDAGIYYVTDTIGIPAGTQIVGEAWVVVQAGAPNSEGVLEISDIVFSTAGPAPGAILLEWNVHDPSGQQGAAGPLGHSHSEEAAFLAIYLAPGIECILRGNLGMDRRPRPRRDLIPSDVNLALHVAFSQSPQVQFGLLGLLYNLANAQNHYVGFAQSETPYYQPVPAAPAPFNSASSSISNLDPTFSESINMAWAMYVQASSDIILFGAGFYSFFQVSRTPNF
ncbi:glycoside hydrolase family 55 protein [Melanogaster broomeanus]|nr:glycoside hydrolase family 55 protein [Melanogaster broomeanus]